ncbi:UDP-3-O-(3-hydroxymyristoyl)glucosamine N-acyltransferase [Planctomicrobium piriforme]|uniref:UDP-3-O-acylglucosamine N-acyltransferase n=1 Tax=Planctomicrobium piriforme TaxID=1576369 RepID=A0A1I3SVD7_9PLAN|nr:UDP-3-O-(3-hydroxymyristoyl)glucosamine N-acyltransferase [Planctomicrobium piriforme]SFJ62755.1 UDP-3-O-[3-hydroxymyristoyl] glucosamine N-acyltransferase [Planctomicrobium piriforme]
MSFSLNDLARNLQATLRADSDIRLSDVASLDCAEAQHLSYADSKKQISAIAKCRAGALLVTAEAAAALPDLKIPLLIVKDPKKSFVEAMLLFRPARSRAKIGHSDRAIIAPSARLGSDCNVFPGAIIGENVVIGDRCDIGPGVIIGDDCQIGDDCILYSHVVLYPDVQLKNRIIVHANAVLGSDGFGYRFSQGALIKIPHTGTVILEDDVEIGACTTIDRAMIEATVIGQGTKVDNHVMIAHNCKIGRHNAFASQVGLAGSVTTGDYVQMGGQVGIADHVHIATQVRLGGGAGVMSDLLVPGVYHDMPAVPEKDALKNHVNIRRISDLRDQVKKLTSQMADLQDQLTRLNQIEPSKSAA